MTFYETAIVTTATILIEQNDNLGCPFEKIHGKENKFI